MPWEETEPMKERIKFILEVEQSAFGFSELCERYGVSRKTGYKWLRRYEQGGLEALRERSRAPHHCPHKTASDVERAIVELRRRRPHWGPVTLRMRLQRDHPEVSWPVESTIGEILKRHDLVRKRRRRRKPQALFATTHLETQQPNQVFTADFKGEFRTRDGRYCYPLTVQDHCSRFSLCCQALSSTRAQPVRERFERVFLDYGLPQAILTDNGVPFAGNGLRRLSRLSVWWIRLGIQPLLIQPGHPEQNGRHERYHRTLKQETALPPAGDHPRQQQRFDRFRHVYNHERPHQHLAGQTPAERYRPSSRSYPRQLPRLEYPGHYEVRRVDTNGYIKLHAHKIFLSEVLRHETVGLEAIHDNLWSIYLGEVLLGRWNERENRIYGGSPDPVS